MSQRLRSVGPVSCAKVFAILYALMGLLVGGLLFLVFSVNAVTGTHGGFSEAMRGGPLSFIMGVGSLFFFPVFYAAVGAISGLIVAGLYNFVAKHLGGIEIEIV